MSRYLMKYKGTYRVRAHIDKSTNDYPRHPDTGDIDPSFDDLYIQCGKGTQIYHYGRSILEAYIPSLKRGRNVMKALGERLNVSLPGGESKTFDYDAFYKELENEGTIKNILETDEEVLFRFNDSKMPLVADILNPQTGGASISPFSTRNLPKSTYCIPADDLSVYREIADLIPQSDKLFISQITKSFMRNILSKNKLYKTVDMRSDMRKKVLKGKEYIHFMGYWDKYIEYLKKETLQYEKSC